ncbi:hypothetical protein [Rhizobium sp. IBUN]|uniref:hypothetical protein n=1 Tax=Rhizobium sp. IBUN TaxID=1042326 RepID=UPI001FDA5E43|nr:hypothetical protein [Rhizobium sp. IBUN]
MTANDNRPDNHSSDRQTAYEAQETALSREGRSLSAVIAAVLLAFSVWTGGGSSPAPRAPAGASSPSTAPPPTQNTN